jgi:2-dehydro-3-deoxy-D-arabinonate dehydratase
LRLLCVSAPLRFDGFVLTGSDIILVKMKVYKAAQGIIIENDRSWYVVSDQNWDTFINDDHLFEKLVKITQNTKPDSTIKDTTIHQYLRAPIQNQEIWACGVTYIRSKVGRQEESKNTGGSEFYARVYEAERPEIFFKATAHRAVGPGGKVSIRKDSTWDVPEPELTLMVTSSGKIIGYTIGNDMSSRSIEGENPLYLPQAKTYDGSAAIGPCIYVTEKPLPKETIIHLDIIRNKTSVFEGEVAISQIKRTFEELVSFLYRECSFPHGCLVMTGTGIVPGSEFTLQKDDEIRITIEPIGMLVNTVG